MEPVYPKTINQDARVVHSGGGSVADGKPPSVIDSRQHGWLTHVGMGRTHRKKKKKQASYRDLAHWRIFGVRMRVDRGTTEPSSPIQAWHLQEGIAVSGAPALPANGKARWTTLAVTT